MTLLSRISSLKSVFERLREEQHHHHHHRQRQRRQQRQQQQQQQQCEEGCSDNESDSDSSADMVFLNGSIIDAAPDCVTLDDSVVSSGEAEYGDGRRIIGRVAFRGLRESDKATIRALHEEWFPVRYKDDFYDALILNKMAGSGEPLVSIVAVLLNDDNHNNSHSNHNNHSVSISPQDDHGFVLCCDPTNDNNNDDTTTGIALDANYHYDYDLETTLPDGQIIGCIVGSFVHSNRCPPQIRPLLISDTTQYSKMFYIMTLGTSHTFRNMGLATHLVHKSIHIAHQDTTCGLVYLHVITYNHTAIKFYEKMGFHRITEITDYYTIDNQNHNCFLYAKYIRGNQPPLTNNTTNHLFTYLSDFVSSLWNTLTNPFYSAFRIE